MQPNKTKLALQIGAVVLGALCASNSYADPFTVTVNTLTDVTIDTEQRLDFGENITTDALGSCAMDADAPAATDVFTDANISATTFGVITGGNCIGSGTTVATPGVYSVSGVGGVDVTLTVSEEPVQTGDFTFTPGGCGVVHDNAAGDTDVCTIYTAGNTLTMTLANGDDDGNAIENFGHFTVGGTLTVGSTALASDSLETVTFNVDVVY
jgi:hypothetical protein